MKNVFGDNELIKLMNMQFGLDDDLETPYSQFLDGFFYIFVLNDPLIRLYLENEKSYYS